jgi:tetratricopeptide (TPR) repeat protein
MNKLLISLFVLILLLLISACRPPEIEGTVLNIKNELYNEALASAETAIQKYPDNAEAWFYWGWLNGEQKKDYAEMNKAFDKALELNPNQKVTFQGGNVSVKDAVEQYRTSKFAENYNSAIKIIPQAQEGEDETKKMELLDQAREKLTLAIDVAPKRIEPYRPLAMAYFNMGDTVQAEIVLEQGLKMHPEDETMLNSAGEIYILSGDTAKAEAIFKKAIEVNPSNSVPYQKLGILESNRENWVKANEYYQKAVELDPDNADLTYNIGVSLYNQQKYDDAIPYFAKSIEVEPDNPLTYIILAGCYVRSETNIDEGIAFLEDAVQRYPEDSGLWEFLAVLYGKKGMKDKAEAAFQKSQELKDN